jgi:hypothetical protein
MKGQLMMGRNLYIIGLLCLLTGCSFRQAGYTVLGAGAGGGIGYVINHNPKDAIIGASSGALVGNLAGQWQDSNVKRKQKKDYDEGYRQAKVDLAIENWQEGTGKDSQNNTDLSKRLVRFKVPKREEDGVIYDEHYVTLEDYQ